MRTRQPRGGYASTSHSAAVAVAVALVITALAASEGLADVVVDVNGGGDHLTIQAGLDAAADGDTVLVLPGLYTGAGNRDLDFGTKNLTLIGQMGSSWTIIDNQGAPDHRVFDFNDTGQDTTCLIRGFAIRGGRTSSANGAGVRCIASSPKFAFCRFEDNVATDGDGGAIAVTSGSTAVVRHSTFSINEADRGGALHTSSNSSPRLGLCEFDGNAAALEGGALFVAAGNGAPRVMRCRFVENESAGNGGAVTCDGGSIDATGCTFLRNTADIGGGAAHATDAASAYFTSCTFVGNAAPVEGGCIKATVESWFVILTKCIIAFTGPCADRTIFTDGQFAPTLIQCCAHGNAPGDNLPGGAAAYLTADPLFCDVTTDELTLASSSPCLPGGNGWGQLIGVHDQGCVESPVEERSWSSIKAMYR